MSRVKSKDITQSLRARIAEAEWGADQKLPNERELAQEYGVARNTVRRAISELSEQGILTRHVGRSTVINETAVLGSSDLSDIIRSLNEISPFDIMNMRLIIEPQAAASAATMGSDSELEAMEEIHQQSIEMEDREKFEKLDMAFHEAIFVATRNELLRNLNEISCIVRRRATVAAIRKNGFSEARRIESIAQHRSILDALKARNPEAAAEAMKLHLAVRSRNIFGGDTPDHMPIGQVL